MFASLGLPGLSGSMILLALGNYKLLLIDSVNALSYSISALMKGSGIETLDQDNKQLIILLLIFSFGSAVGLILFSKILNHLIFRYKNIIMSCLVGFISGSIGSVWPWSSINYEDNFGTLFLRSNNIFFYYPNNLNTKNITILTSIAIGVLIVFIIEKINGKN